jgi:hypothetical protein
MGRTIRLGKIYFMRKENFPLKVCGGFADKKIKERCPFTAEPAGKAGRSKTRDGEVNIP